MRGQHWQVIGGGGDKGGILVRAERGLASEQLLERLCHGAVVRERELTGDRLHYEKVVGRGPESGWVSIKLKDKDLLKRLETSSLDEGSMDRIRIWAVSDIHTDKAENMGWIKNLDTAEFKEDVLIIAGDVANTLDALKQALNECRQRFKRVFFCPGNHDLWMQGQKTGDSMEKLRSILEFCKASTIETSPGIVDTGAQRVLVVPLLAWHQPQWDTEPELKEWKDVPTAERTVSDYWLTKWLHPLRIDDGSVARALDELNDEGGSMAELVRQRAAYDAVVSFSHFVPRIELNPEKRYLIPSCLAKAVGSVYLQKRVESLRPDVHVFGHTHFGWDLDIEGIRYIQAPLATPGERAYGGSIVALGNFPTIEAKPCLIWDSSTGWAPRYRSSWSEYYNRYGRKPHVTDLVPSVCSNIYTPSQDCRAGWIAGRMPIWLFGPLQNRLFEAQVVIDEVHNVTGMKARAKAKASPKSKANKMQRSSSGEPEVIRVAEALRLFVENRSTFVDIRKDADTPGEKRITGSVPLPHPGLTETMAALPDEELLALCERLNARGGQFVLYGTEDGAEECWDAAMLLAGYFRMWPKSVKIIQGGLRAWISQDGSTETAPVDEGS